MSNFRWIGGQKGPSTGDYASPSNWVDLTNGTTGEAAPQVGDTVDITAAPVPPDPLGALFLLAPNETVVDFFDFSSLQNQNLELTDPSALVGDTIHNQAIDVDATAGMPALWLQASTLDNVAMTVVGSVDMLAFLTNEMSGTLALGNGSAPAFMQIEIVGGDSSRVAPGTLPQIMQLNSNVTVASQATLQVEGVADASAPSGLTFENTIAVDPGGTFIIDDTDDTTNKGPLADAILNNDFGVLNYGTLLVNGAPGRATSVLMNANSGGTGSIVLNGNGADMSATSLIVNGGMENQTIMVSDATVTFNDAFDVVNVATGDGFNVTQDSFVFTGAPSKLFLHQIDLTYLTFNSTDTELIETPNGRDPFASRIFGFGTGDVIALVNKDVGFDYYLTFDSATGVLQVDAKPSIQGDPPDILASLTFDGAYNPTLFQLNGNTTTEELDITYGGTPSVPATPPTNIVTASTPGDIKAAAYQAENVELISPTVAGQTFSLTHGYTTASVTGSLAVTVTDSNGNALLEGGAGNTTLIAYAAADTLQAGAGASALVAINGNAVESATSTLGNTLFYGGTAPDTVMGGPNQDIAILPGGGVITTGGGGSQVWLSTGTASITSQGADTIVGGSGSETVSVGGKSDLAFGGSGSMVFEGGASASTVVGFADSTTVLGNTGGGIFFGGSAGNNLLQSGTGFAEMIGGGNGDTLVASGSANDVLEATYGAETLNAGGSTGNDALFGGVGSDCLVGGTGNEVFTAGPGSMTMVSAGAADLFVFLNGTASNTLIQGFNPLHDFIKLSNFQAGEDQAAYAGLTSTGSGTLITLSDGTKIILAGPAPSSLSAGNFI